MHWSASDWPTPSSGRPRSPGASARWDPTGQLLGVDERRQVTARPDGTFASADGQEPSELSPDARVSMNLWGFTPSFHKTLQVAMAAATDASEEAEVLLPEVVGRVPRLFPVHRATGERTVHRGHAPR